MTIREDIVRNIDGTEVPVRVEETHRYDEYHYERWWHIVTVEGDLNDVATDEVVRKFSKPLESRYLKGWHIYTYCANIVTRKPNKIVFEQLVCGGE